MKINKFQIIKYVVFGLTAFTATTQASKFAGVSLDPRIEIASRVSPVVQEGLVQSGNHSWNSEIRQENKDFYDVSFENKDDFEEITFNNFGCFK